MPISPSIAETQALKVMSYYENAERILAAKIASNYRKGLDIPNWAVLKLAEVRRLEKETRELLAALRAQAESGIREAVTLAYEQGGLAAVQDLSANVMYARSPRLAGQLADKAFGSAAIERLTQEALGYVTATHNGILRSVMDNNQRVIAAGQQYDEQNQQYEYDEDQEERQRQLREGTADAAGEILTGARSRIQAIQNALNKFAGKGITGFVDKSGRGWSMEAYTEMATRTAAGRAAVQGHLDRLHDEGIQLVIVSDAPRECPLCRPWEGKVLSIGSVQVEIPPDADPAFLQEEEYPQEPGAGVVAIPGALAPTFRTPKPLSEADKIRHALWKQNNKDKNRAHAAVARAIKAGKLTPQPCMI